MTTLVSAKPTRATAIPSAAEAALSEVRTILRALLEAADQQHAAVVSEDIAALEAALARQEVLSTRLHRAERQRTRALPGRSLREAVERLPAAEAHTVSAQLADIAELVLALRERHARNRRLLERGATIAHDTVRFLHRLAERGTDPGTYAPTPTAPATPARSVVLDLSA